MSLSSFCVVTNALRLNLVRIHDGSKDKAIHPITLDIPKEEPIMEKTMKIEGMMCTHCEARVKKGLGGSGPCGERPGQPRGRYSRGDALCGCGQRRAEKRRRSPGLPVTSIQ